MGVAGVHLPDGETFEALAVQINERERGSCSYADCPFTIQVSVERVAVGATTTAIYKVQTGCPRSCTSSGIKTVHANSDLRMTAQGFLSYPTASPELGVADE